MINPTDQPDLQTFIDAANLVRLNRVQGDPSGTEGNLTPIAGLVMQDDASGFFAQAFTDTDGNIIVAYDGFDFSRTTDYSIGTIATGAALWRGQPPFVFIEAGYFADMVAQTIGAPIYVTGQSLGGTEAEFAALVLGPEILGGVTFGASGVPKYAADVFDPPLANYVMQSELFGNYATDALFALVSAVGDHAGNVNLIGTAPSSDELAALEIMAMKGPGDRLVAGVLAILDDNLPNPLEPYASALGLVVPAFAPLQPPLLVHLNVAQALGLPDLQPLLSGLHYEIAIRDTVAALTAHSGAIQTFATGGHLDYVRADHLDGGYDVHHFGIDQTLGGLIQYTSHDVVHDSSGNMTFGSFYDDQFRVVAIQFFDASGSWERETQQFSGLFQQKIIHTDGSYDFLQFHIQNQPYTSVERSFDDHGTLTSLTQFRDDHTRYHSKTIVAGDLVLDDYDAAGNVVKETVKHTDGSKDVSIFNIVNKPFTESHSAYDSNHTLIESDHTNLDGTRSVTAYAADLTLTSTTAVEKFNSFGFDDTFVFRANFGNDVISHFNAGGATGHDIIGIDASLVNSLSDIHYTPVNHNHDVQISIGGPDTITVKNVQIADLQQDVVLVPHV